MLKVAIWAAVSSEEQAKARAFNAHKVVNQWIREHLRIEFNEDREIIVLLS